MNTKELQRMVKFARENGVLKVKTKDLEIELSPSSLFPQELKLNIEEPSKPMKPQYTDEEILMWSVPDMDPLKEEAG